MGDVEFVVTSRAKGARKAAAGVRKLGKSLDRASRSMKKAKAAGGNFEQSLRKITTGGVIGFTIVALDQLATKAANAAKSIYDMAQSGAVAIDMARHFTGSMESLRAASANAIDDTTLQQFAHLADEAGLTRKQFENLATEIVFQATQSGKATEATRFLEAALKGSRRELVQIGLHYDNSQEALRGFTEEQKKLIMLRDFAARGETRTLDNLESESLAYVRVNTALANLQSSIEEYVATKIDEHDVIDRLSDSGDRLAETYRRNQDEIDQLVSISLDALIVAIDTQVRRLEMWADALGAVADAYREVEGWVDSVTSKLEAAVTAVTGEDTSSRAGEVWDPMKKAWSEIGETIGTDAESARKFYTAAAEARRTFHELDMEIRRGQLRPDTSGLKRISRGRGRRETGPSPAEIAAAGAMVSAQFGAQEAASARLVHTFTVDLPDAALIYFNIVKSGMAETTAGWIEAHQEMEKAARKSAINAGIAAAAATAKSREESAQSLRQGVMDWPSFAEGAISSSARMLGGVLAQERVQAGLMVPLEIAKAAASYPNYVGMAQHAFAAVTFAAFAAGAGAGAGGGTASANGDWARRASPPSGPGFNRVRGGGDLAKESVDTGAKETTVVYLEVNRRRLGEATIEGMNESARRGSGIRMSKKVVGNSRRRFA